MLAAMYRVSGLRHRGGATGLCSTRPAQSSERRDRVDGSSIESGGRGRGGSSLAPACQFVAAWSPHLPGGIRNDAGFSEASDGDVGDVRREIGQKSGTVKFLQTKFFAILCNVAKKN